MAHLKFRLVGFACLLALGASLSAQNGRAAAEYAFNNIWDGYQQDRLDSAAFVSRAQRAGGWSEVGRPNVNAPGAWFNGTTSSTRSRSWMIPSSFVGFLQASRRGLLLQEITPTSRTVFDSSWPQPGDIIAADWGAGDESKTALQNAADGVPDHLMVVIQNLGNGDFVYAQHSAPLARRLSSLLASPNLSRARYRLYRVSGNDAMRGLWEGSMYKDANRQEVFLAANCGLFLLPTSAEVGALGGWGRVVTLPSNTLGPIRGRAPIAGTMLKEINRPENWLASGLSRRWIRSDAAINRFGGSAAIRVVPSGSLKQIYYFQGPDIWS